MTSGTAFVYEQRHLENDLVSLEIFDPSLHTKQFVNTCRDNPHFLDYVSFPIPDTEEAFTTNFYDPIRSSPEHCVFAIFNKLSPLGGQRTEDNYAGIIGLTETSEKHASTEVAIIVFPKFQRTHITTNAVALLLFWALDPPSAGGLGLRRVEWSTNSENEPSRRAALRIGFEFEGILRWHKAFPRGKVAQSVKALEHRNCTKGEMLGKHTAVYSIVWEEWEEKRCKIEALLRK